MLTINKSPKYLCKFAITFKRSVAYVCRLSFIFFFFAVFLFFQKIKNLQKTSGDLGDLRVKDLTPTTESMTETII